jgi:hypothetical protein
VKNGVKYYSNDGVNSVDGLDRLEWWLDTRGERRRIEILLKAVRM